MSKYIPIFLKKRRVCGWVHGVCRDEEKRADCKCLVTRCDDVLYVEHESNSPSMLPTARLWAGETRMWHTLPAARMGRLERADLKQAFGVVCSFVFRTAKLKQPIRVPSGAAQACNRSTQEAEAWESWGFLIVSIVLLDGRWNLHCLPVRQVLYHWAYILSQGAWV